MKSVSLLVIAAVIGVTGLRAAEVPTVALDVLLDRYSVRAQAQQLPSKSAVVQLAITNRGAVALTVDGTAPSGQRRPRPVVGDTALRVADNSATSVTTDPHVLTLVIDAAVDGEQQLSFAADRGPHDVHPMTLLPGTTVLVPVHIPEALVRPGENATLTITVRTADGAVAAPSFAVHRDEQ